MGISPIRTNSATRVDTRKNRFSTGIPHNTSAPASSQASVSAGIRNSSKAATEAQDLPSLRRKLGLPSDTVVCTSIDGDLATFSGASIKLCNGMKHHTPTKEAVPASEEKADHIIRMLNSNQLFRQD